MFLESFIKTIRPDEHVNMISVSYVHLESFFYVARYGGFTAASKATNKATSNLSSQIKNLEEHLGVQLLERSQKKCTLTDAGKRLLFFITPFFENVDQIGSIVRDGSATVIFASTQTILLYRLRPIMRMFRRQFPEVGIKVLERRWNEMVELVDEGMVDFALTPVPNLPKHIMFRECLSSPPALIVPKDHPLARRKEVGLEEIATYPLVLYEKDELTQKRIDSVFAQKKLRYQKVFEATNTATVVEYVLDGMGIAIIPAFALTEENKKQLKIFNLAKLLGSTPAGVIYHRNRLLSPYCQEFIRLFDPTFSAGKAQVQIEK